MLDWQQGTRQYFPCGNESVSHSNSEIRGNTGTCDSLTNARDSKNVPVGHNDRVETVRRNSRISVPTLFRGTIELIESGIENRVLLNPPPNSIHLRAQFFPCVFFKDDFSLSFSLSFYSILSVRPIWRLFCHCAETIAKVIKELVRRRTTGNVNIKCHENYSIVGLECS